MFRYKWIGFLISVSAFFQNLGFDPALQGFEKGNRDYQIRKMARLDFLESSGLEINEEGGWWTHNDSGGSPAIFLIDPADFTITDSVAITDSRNRDWEEIAQDDKGNLYIGDFGNNANRRTDLMIYRVGMAVTDTIRFRYPDQEEFPPVQDEMNFDCEAMFWHDSHLYLFSKNRGKKMVKAYRLPDQPGEYVAELIDEIRINRMITAADISPDGSEFSLLCYGMIYTFKFTDPNQPFDSPLSAVRFSRSGQAEALVYETDSALWMTNESGKLFRMLNKRGN